MLPTIIDRDFTNTALFLDGTRFVNCRFVDCQLIYDGSEEVDFQDCTFERCSWTFDAAAERTIGFLSTLYRETGPDGVALVEGIFKSIRNEQVHQLRVSDRAELKTEEVATVERRPA